MELMTITAVLILGLSGVFLEYKSDRKFLTFINVLLFAIVALTISEEFDALGSRLLFTGVGVVALNYAASRISALRKGVLRVVVPIVSFVVVVFMFMNETVTVMGDGYRAMDKFLIVGTFIGVLSFELYQLKRYALEKMFAFTNEGLERLVVLIFAAIAIYLGIFSASALGGMLVTAALLSASFYHEEGVGRSIPVTLITFSVLPILISGTENGVNLASGDVLAGVLFGASGLLLVQLVYSAKKSKGLLVAVGYFIALSMVLGLFFAGGTFAKMGGQDALIAALLGLSIAGVVKGEGYVSMSLFALFFAAAFTLPELTKNKELEQFENEMMIVQESSSTEEGEEKQPELVLLPLEELAGKGEINPEASKISFELGENGETKGAFKKVSGAIVVADDIEKSTIKINLAMDDFTTFNGMRDDHLMGDEYFKADKYPTMKYTGKSLKKLADNEYEIQGDFTMLGVTKPVLVTLKRVEVEGKSVLIGSGEVDRVEFGMTPSATEGNVVTFNYQLELK